MAASNPVSFLLFIALASPLFGGEVERMALNDAPRVTVTKLGIKGDPINVALIGTKDELIAAMVAAKWQPADQITFRTSLRIAKSVMLRRPDETAPVSNLYLWGRAEDLAFEQEVGGDARRRHHVRFWLSAKQVNGRPLWLGAATFDTKVGLSHKTGMITHHIDRNIDADRDKLMRDLAASLLTTDAVEGFQPNHDGRNGGGDPYHTDGKLSVGVLDGR